MESLYTPREIPDVSYFALKKSIKKSSKLSFDREQLMEMKWKL